ncbi:MAG: class I SAM-dependent methyltransferase [Candidatus Bathyarchaeota archaeon]|jgi:ubiquinone/menaquinone biosynthesis C-methylase UbiE
MNEKLPESFWTIHSGLPREGPGDNESTRRAYRMLKDLPENPRILDVGCGPGMQTIELTKLSDGPIIALDFHEPLLKQLQEAAKKEGVSNRIKAVKGDMFNLEFEDNHFDVIWSEGAIFVIGFEKGLREWKRLLTPKGYVVVSELCWLKDGAPQEAKKYVTQVYPPVKTIEENIEIIENSGYRLVGSFVLPSKSWWDNYYTPIERKLPVLKAKYKDDKEALQVIACEEIEIESFRKYSDYYGYVFYVTQVN